ncbi:MAG: DUF1588 domain-containing protein, partial [Myxococcota bacterium]|nr:DUF1588 domain-containing protein [Myxococcota bacterium]
PYFSELMFSTRAWTHPNLGASYDLDSAQENWQPTLLPEEERLGLLTRSAFLSAHASSATSSPVRRGAFILQELLCEELPPLPDVDMEIPIESSETPTIRERLAVHSENSSCMACHDRIDNAGFAFENYGAMGEWRETWESGIPVDATGTLNQSDFSNAVDLLSQIGDSPQAQRCYAKKWFSYAIGRPLQAEEACDLHRIQTRFVQSGGNIQSLLIDISISDTFLYLPRREP